MNDYWQSPSLGHAAFNLALADFDQDGFDDIFVGTFGDGALRIYRNHPGAGIELWWQGSVPGEDYTGTVADLDDDGAPDLIVGEENSIRVMIHRTGRPRITRLAPAGDGMAIVWTAVPGKVYRVQFKTRWDEPTWRRLSGNVTAAGVTASKTDRAASTSAQRFYRIVQLP